MLRFNQTLLARHQTGNRSGRKMLLFCSVMALSGLETRAKSEQVIPPQKEYYLGEENIDLHKGAFLYASRDLTVGQPDTSSHLQFVRYFNASGGTGTPKNLDMIVAIEEFLVDPHPFPFFSHTFTLTFGRSVIGSFIRGYGSGTNIWPVDGGGRFEALGQFGPFRYTSSDGTVYNFQSGSSATCRHLGCGRITDFERPGGSRNEFFYKTLSGGGGFGEGWRLALVTNNNGFAIGFKYDVDSGNARELVVGACSINLSLVHANVDNPCLNATRFISYDYSPLMRDPATFTDASGGITSYGYNSFNQLSTIRLPGSVIDDLTISYDNSSHKVTSRTYANGSTWSYNYQSNWPWHVIPFNEWTDVTEPLANITRHAFAWGAPPKPGSITDPLNRATQFRYVENRPHLLRKRELPAGGYTEYTYDNRDNLIETRAVATPGSGLADIVTSASFVSTPVYPYICTNQKTCNQPEYTIDANGGRTDYDYDPVHGGVVTETGPIVGGIRPQVRHGYTLRHAWIRNSLGGYIQASHPIWLRTTTSYCRTSAATGNPASPCATAADEVVTAYDYGPDSGPNNLLLRGHVVTADGVSLRTCYSYDDTGRRLSKTDPRAGLTTCP